eukprot:SAG22_NODE_129_length_18679_cov_40.656028_17_plen_45_part_00
MNGTFTMLSTVNVRFKPFLPPCYCIMYIRPEVRDSGLNLARKRP